MTLCNILLFYDKVMNITLNIFDTNLELRQNSGIIYSNENLNRFFMQRMTQELKISIFSQCNNFFLQLVIDICTEDRVRFVLMIKPKLQVENNMLQRGAILLMLIN